ncbi:MAG: CBS domain-containing protein [Thermoproteota archaeon]
MRGVPTPPRRPEGLRWLRDGKPNFSDRIRKKEGEAKILARRPVYTATRTFTILGLAEEMSRYRVRALPVVSPSDNKLEGLVTVMDIVNYLGGGELHDIVVNRHGGNLYSALLREHASSIMSKNPAYVTVYDKLTDILETMITREVGVLPVVTEDGVLWGIITEHDIVSHLSEKKVGVPVSEVMTRNVIHTTASATLGEAAKTMVRVGVRRLPVLDGDRVVGMLTAKDVVRFVGKHEVFRYLEVPTAEALAQLPIKVVGFSGFDTIEPSADVGDAATKMMEKGLSSLLVVDEKGALQGIVTERDVLYALAVKS